MHVTSVISTRLESSKCLQCFFVSYSNTKKDFWKKFSTVKKSTKSRPHLNPFVHSSLSGLGETLVEVAIKQSITLNLLQIFETTGFLQVV